MKKNLKPYRHLLALFAVILGAVALAHLGMPPVACAMLVGCYQLSQIAMSKRQAMCYTTALSPEQIKEFEGILDGFKGYNAMFKELADLAKVEGGYDHCYILSRKGEGLSLAARVSELRRITHFIEKPIALRG